MSEKEKENCAFFSFLEGNKIFWGGKEFSFTWVPQRIPFNTIFSQKMCSVIQFPNDNNT